MAIVGSWGLFTGSLWRARQGIVLFLPPSSPALAAWLPWPGLEGIPLTKWNERFGINWQTCTKKMPHFECALRVLLCCEL